LSLDSVQYATIKGINRKYADRARTMRHDTVRTVDAKRDDWKQLRDSRKDEIDKVLTPEQRTKWQNLRDRRVQDRRNARLDAMVKRDDRLKSRLSLTDEQLSKMKTARKASHEQARKEYESELAKILTKEQFENWKKGQEEKKDGKQKK